MKDGGAKLAVILAQKGTNVKHILVTGAAGYIGSNLVKKLLTDREKVSVILKKSTDVSLLAGCRSRLNVYYDEGSIEDMAGFLSACQVDCVIHLATCYVTLHRPEDVDRMLESNVRFGARLLEAMRIAGVNRIIYARTSWQHYQNEGFNPVNLYAATKQAFEDIMKYYTQAEGFCSMILEIYDTYGENDPRSKILNLMKRRCLDGEPIALSPGEQKLDFLYIEDAVEGFLTAIERMRQPPSREMEYALSSNEVHTLKDVVRIFERAYGAVLNIEWGKYQYRQREIFTPYRGLARLEGWQAKYSLYEGFCRMKESEQGESDCLRQVQNWGG